MDLGRWARTQASERLGDRVIGITGSVGKTSVKDLTAAALARPLADGGQRPLVQQRAGPAGHAPGAADDAEALVLEMGMRGPGEIARAVRGRPADDRASSRSSPPPTPNAWATSRAWPRAKAELVEALPAGGVAILNADDRTGGGDGLPHRGPGADVRNHGGGRRRRPRSGAVRRCPSPIHAARTPWGEVEVALAVPGAHMATQRRRRPRPSRWCATCRWRTRPAHSARPPCRPGAWSCAARPAARSCSTTPTTPTRPRCAPPCPRWRRSRPRRRVAIVGLMAELDDPEPAHRAIAEEAERLGIELVLVGDRALRGAAGGRPAGGARSRRAKATPSSSRARVWPVWRQWPPACCPLSRG